MPELRSSTPKQTAFIVTRLWFRPLVFGTSFSCLLSFWERLHLRPALSPPLSRRKLNYLPPIERRRWSTIGRLHSRRISIRASLKNIPRSRRTKLQPAQIASHGIASFYTTGTKTASGERFDTNELTAAHRTLPFGTRLRVTNVATGQSVTVRVNDRGPFIPGRIVDVSYSAATTLGMVGGGIAKVKLEVVE